MSPALDHQPGTLSKEQRNLHPLSYATTLQKEAERGSALGNVIVPRSNKRNWIVLYDTPKDSKFPYFKDTKRIKNGETTTETTNDIASVTLTTTMTT